MSDKVKLSLRLLSIQSLLAMFVGIVCALDTKSDSFFAAFAFLFAGAIGGTAYQSFVAVMKRVENLEAQSLSHAAPASSAENAGS